MNTNLQAKDSPVVESTVKSATVFFSGAEIVHEAKAGLNKGVNLLEISGLSHVVDVNSVRIKTSGGVTVSSFEFILKPSETNNELKKMQDTMNVYLDKIAKIRNDIRINASFIETLNKALLGVATEKQGSSEHFVGLMEYYGKKSGESETQLYNKKIDEAGVQKLIDDLSRRMQQLRNKNSVNVGALKLSLSSPAAAECSFTVMYYTASASWIPYHDIRITSIDKPVKITSKAKVSQNTGIEWKQAKLKLSTSIPSFGKTAPLFRTWILREIAPITTRGFSTQNSISYSKKALSESLTTFAADMDDKRIAEDSEVVEFQNMNNHIALSDNTMNLIYDIDLPYTIAGDGSVRNIELLTQETSAEYKHYCAPKLDNNTFLIAEIYNWEKLNLLSGTANITYDETFVGETYIDALYTGDVLELTLGVDNRVAVKREKINEMSSKKIFGNDIKQEFTYRLTVRNNQNRAIKMVLKDQYPISVKKQIEVTLHKDITPPSANKPETGVLTWEREIEQGTSQTCTFGYSVKYPKELVLDL